MSSSATSVISALKWVPRKYMLTQPIQYALSKEEEEEFKKNASGNGEEEEENVVEDMEEGEEAEMLTDADVKLEMALNQLNLEKDGIINNDDSDLGSDVEDHNLKYTDKILVSATIDDEHASLEVHVYDTENGSLYVHHDITLPAYPLCLEWLGVDGPQLQWTPENLPSKSFMAVGTLEPNIEIWSLDILDALEPNAVLEGHEDAVLCMHWNENHAQVLASGSGDHSIVVWDLPTSKPASRLRKLHTDKVQSVCWNPAEKSVLLTGSFDKSVCVVDVRAPEQPTRFKLKAQVECLSWDPHHPERFGVASEDGRVAFYDVRSKAAVSRFQATESEKHACSSLVANAHVPDLWATCGTDRVLKLWDLQSAPARLVASKRASIGKLFACQFAEPGEEEEELDPFLLAAGGSKGSVAIWHAANDADDPDATANVKKAFASRVLRERKKWV